MFLLKTIVLASALLQLEASSFFTASTYNSTKDWSVKRHPHRFFPLVVKSNNSLIHVLDTNSTKHTLQIESLDFEPACKLPLKLTYPDRYPRRAATLANGKLVIWLLNYQLTRYQHSGEWRFVIVEPRDCSYRSFVINDAEDVIGVVGYLDSFDVFVTSLAHDQPRNIYAHRYGDKGEPIPEIISSVIQDSDSHPFYRPKTISIFPLKEHDDGKGYFYVQSKPRENSSIVKRLNSDFEVTWRKTLDRTNYNSFGNEVHSTEYGSLSVCRYGYEEDAYLHCRLLNGLLQEKLNVTLNYNIYADYPTRIAKVKINNLANGGLLVIFALNVNPRVGVTIFAQRIDVDGGQSKLAELGKLYFEIHRIDSFEMNPGEYCIVVTDDEFVHTKCIKV